MKFIHIDIHIINADHIIRVKREPNNTVTVYLPKGWFTFPLERWNKAVREAGVPGLQFF